MNFSIRTFSDDDADALARLIAAALRGIPDSDVDAHSRDAEIARQHPSTIREQARVGTTLVAMTQDTCLGTASLRGSTVFSLFVDTEVRRRGIGSALLREIMAVAKAEHRDVVRTAAVRSACAFYARHGFVIESESIHEGSTFFSMTARLS